MVTTDSSLSSLSTSKSVGPVTWDDATWILTSSFIIFTMQSGLPPWNDQPPGDYVITCYNLADMDTLTFGTMATSCNSDLDLDSTGLKCNPKLGLHNMIHETPEVMTISSGLKINGVITWDDATWILSCSFMIFTMQTGFGLLEAGCVSRRNEVNIMVKNAVDVVFGGLTYWAFGFGLSFGDSPGTNPFCGVGLFFVDATHSEMGIIFSTFVFQLSFATTATTIVSGAMAERTKLISYIVFSLLNTIVYCIPAHWEWAKNGFLRTLGVVDIAGSGAVHLVGGVSAFVASFLLKPRTGRYSEGQKATENPLPMGNPANTLIGMFMLWWGWLAFNCGSTFGISGGKWKLAAKSAVTTLNGSMGGGIVGIILSYIMKKGTLDVGYLVNSILGALVGITAGCAVVRPWEAIVIGIIGGVLAIFSAILMDKIRIDDPVGAVAVHGVCGIWGMLAVGLFAANDPLEDTTQGREGLFHGGGMHLLGVQTLACVVITAWSGIVSAILLLGIKFTIGLRMTIEDEMMGADYVEHGIGAPNRLNYGDRGLLSPPIRTPTPSVCSAMTSGSIKSFTEHHNGDVKSLSRQRLKRIRSDKVVPLNGIPGEVQNTSSSPVTIENL